MEKYSFLIFYKPEERKNIAALHLMVPTSAVVIQAHQLDPTKHYLRLKFLIENQVQFYIPKPEEDVCDLVCKVGKKKRLLLLLFLFSRQEM